MIYNNTRTDAGQVMPLLMGCTKPVPIEFEEVDHNIIYDPENLSHGNWPWNKS